MATNPIEVSNVEFQRMADFAPNKKTYNGSFPRDGVKLGIRKKQNDVSYADIVIGENVVKDLHWQHGDRYDVLFNDYAILIRRDNKGLWSLRTDGHKEGRLQAIFKAHAGPLRGQERRSRKEVGHSIVDGDLVVVIQ